MNQTIYLDNNATTKVAPEVLESMLPYFTDEYFNPSSLYDQARVAADALKKARKTITRFLNATNENEILFTSCATESNNTALFGVLRAQKKRRHVITTAVEHPAVLEVCREIQRMGYDVTFLPVDEQGRLSERDFVKALQNDTAIVSIMHGNNETGVLFPVGELARITKETDPSIVVHTDATQTVTKLPIHMNETFKHVDLLSFSGHKIHAPKGIGALFIRRGTPFRAFMMGGHQEKHRRAGTENVPYIVGLARAVELAEEHMHSEKQEIQALRDHLEQEITIQIPRVRINGAEAPRLPNTSNMAFEYIEGEGILQMLNEQGICASSGSACTSGTLEPSHVLSAMNIPFTAAHGSIRFSLSRYTTKEEIDRVIQVFPDIIERIRKISPYWKKEYETSLNG
jgi:cysteine desulfurase